MKTVLCAIDGSVASREAARQAIEFTGQHGLELGLVGVVPLPRLDPPQPAHGARARRFLQVQDELIRASEAAKQAGILPAISLRAGDPEAELRDEAASTGATDLFVPGLKRRLLAKSSVRVEHLTLPTVATPRTAIRAAA